MAVSQQTASELEPNLLFASTWSDNWDVSDVIQGGLL